MENTWKMRKCTKCPGNICEVLANHRLGYKSSY
uniref:Uncharacterized protein n=1 Tax=Anguilla anguilla TaxID=7936 RepID=A0A0E9XKH9_ANGAN